MGVKQVMMIRHAEKPGVYPFGDSEGLQYDGIDPFGQPDPDSLVTMGWERAGGIASLFYLTNSNVINMGLGLPDVIYASNPAFTMGMQANGNIQQQQPSQRPYQTISALYARTQGFGVTLNLSFAGSDYKKMVSDVLSLEYATTVLIAWQHQDILRNKKDPSDLDCIVQEFINKTGPVNFTIPVNPWPDSRYDMVLVLNRPSGTGAFTSFAQVPQMLLAGDQTTPFT